MNMKRIGNYSIVAVAIVAALIGGCKGSKKDKRLLVKQRLLFPAQDRIILPPTKYFAPTPLEKAWIR